LSFFFFSFFFFFSILLLSLSLSTSTNNWKKTEKEKNRESHNEVLCVAFHCVVDRGGGTCSGHRPVGEVGQGVRGTDTLAFYCKRMIFFGVVMNDIL